MLTLVNICQFMGGWTLDYAEHLSFYEIINLSLMQAEVNDYQTKLSKLKSDELKAKYKTHGRHRKNYFR